MHSVDQQIASLQTDAMPGENGVSQTFDKPPKLRELGAACDQSYWSIRRLVTSGVAPTVSFPDGERVQTDWANRYCQYGLTEQELQRYRNAMRQQREMGIRSCGRGAA